MAQLLSIVESLLIPLLLASLTILNRHNPSMEKISSFVFSFESKIVDHSGIERELKRIACSSVAIVASLWYCFRICAKFPKGVLRLISLAPIFSFFTVLPLYFTTAFFTIIFTFFFTWLANFKLLLFAFDQGPTASVPLNPLPVRAIIAGLPINLKRKAKHPHERKSRKLPIYLGTEILSLPFFLGAVREYKQPLILQAGYCCILFLVLDIVLCIVNFLVGVIVRLELDLPSNEPYLSTSIKEFWGLRWDLVATNSLRDIIYKPVRSAANKFVGTQLSLAFAGLVAFLVSGLMHELIFYNVMRVSPSWEVTIFFVLQGIVVVMEHWLSEALTKKWRLPRFIGWLLTLGFLVVTSFWLFYPPLLRNGGDVRIIGELCFFWELIKDEFIRLCSFFRGIVV